MSWYSIKWTQYLLSYVTIWFNPIYATTAQHCLPWKLNALSILVTRYRLRFQEGKITFVMFNWRIKKFATGFFAKRTRHVSIIRATSICANLDVKTLQLSKLKVNFVCFRSCVSFCTMSESIHRCRCLRLYLFSNIHLLGIKIIIFDIKLNRICFIMLCNYNTTFLDWTLIYSKLVE